MFKVSIHKHFFLSLTMNSKSVCYLNYAEGENWLTTKRKSMKEVQTKEIQIGKFPFSHLSLL